MTARQSFEVQVELDPMARLRIMTAATIAGGMLANENGFAGASYESRTAHDALRVADNIIGLVVRGGL